MKAFKNLYNNLKSAYYCELHENVIHISLDNKSLPFAILLEENEDVLVSLSVDFHDNYIIAEFIQNLGGLTTFKLAEMFYLENNGYISFGEEAALTAAIESGFDLLNMEPISKEIN